MINELTLLTEIVRVLERETIGTPRWSHLLWGHLLQRGRGMVIPAGTVRFGASNRPNLRNSGNGPNTITSPIPGH